MAAKKKAKKPRPAPPEVQSAPAADEAPPSPSPRPPRPRLAPLPPLPAPLEQPVPPPELALVDNPAAIAVVLALVLAVLVGLTWKRAPSGPSGGPLTAVPRESFLVGRVDVPTLRASPLFATVLGDPDASRSLGLDELARGCGFDPLARVKELVVVLPEGESRGTFGLAAQVTVTESELATCAQRISEARGGVATPKTVGSFHVLEDPRGSKPGLAFREGGLLLVAEGSWLASMISAADSAEQGAKGAHTDLHGTLAAGIGADPRLAAPTALVTAVLPRPLRERLRAELGEEIARAAGGPDGADTPQAIMSAVLSVAGAGLGVALGGADGQVSARAELACEDPASAQVLARLVERKRFGWSKELWVRLIGLGGAVDSITVEPRGTTLSVGLHAPTDELSRGVARLLELGQKKLKPPAPGASPPPAAPPAPRPPDEVLKPKGQIRGTPP